MRQSQNTGFQHIETFENNPKGQEALKRRQQELAAQGISTQQVPNIRSGVVLKIHLAYN